MIQTQKNKFVALPTFDPFHRFGLKDKFFTEYMNHNFKYIPVENISKLLDIKTRIEFTSSVEVFALLSQFEKYIGLNDKSTYIVYHKNENEKTIYIIMLGYSYMWKYAIPENLSSLSSIECLMNLRERFLSIYNLPDIKKSKLILSTQLITNYNHINKIMFTFVASLWKKCGGF